MAYEPTPLVMEFVALEKELIINGVLHSPIGGHDAALTEDYIPDEADAVEAEGMVRWCVSEVRLGRMKVTESWYMRAKAALDAVDAGEVKR